MQTVTVKLPAAGTYKNQPASGDFFMVKAMAGTILKVTAVAKGGGTETVWVAVNEPVRFDSEFTNLQLTSNSPNDVVTFTTGKGYIWPLGLIQLVMKMVDQFNNQWPFFTADTKNLAAAPADTVGGGSAVPGGSFGTVLVGETFVAIRLDPATYVSGKSGAPTIETAGGAPLVPAEMIDMTTGEIVNSISSPATWYKIKTQGASLLNIPVGTILGNAPVTQAFNFALERGYSEWEQQINPSYTVLNFSDAGTNLPHFSRLITRPEKAKGFNLKMTTNFTAAMNQITPVIWPQDNNDPAYNPLPADLTAIPNGQNYEFTNSVPDPGGPYPMKSFFLVSLQQGFTAFNNGQALQLEPTSALVIGVQDLAKTGIAYDFKCVIEWYY